VRISREVGDRLPLVHATLELLPAPLPFDRGHVLGLVEVGRHARRCCEQLCLQTRASRRFLDVALEGLELGTARLELFMGLKSDASEVGCLCLGQVRLCCQVQGNHSLSHRARRACRARHVALHGEHLERGQRTRARREVKEFGGVMGAEGRRLGQPHVGRDRARHDQQRRVTHVLTSEQRRTVERRAVVEEHAVQKQRRLLHRDRYVVRLAAQILKILAQQPDARERTHRRAEAAFVEGLLFAGALVGGVESEIDHEPNCEAETVDRLDDAEPRA